MPLLSDGIHIGPALTREEFLASPLAVQSRELIRNEPHRSFALPVVPYGGHSLVLSLWFQGPVLRRVSIRCADVEMPAGSSPLEWSEAHEQTRKSFHDSLLQASLGPDWDHRHYSWGTVESCQDPKGGFSSIEITYADKPSPSMRQFIVDLSAAETFEDFVAAFNAGFCRHAGGEWHGRSWDAFHDYLSWPEDDTYKLEFRGWNTTNTLSEGERGMIQEIFRDNPHVHVTFC
jgi:hypothetical protein